MAVSGKACQFVRYTGLTGKETATQAMMVSTPPIGGSLFSRLLEQQIYGTSPLTWGAKLPERSGRMYVSDWIKKHYPKTEDADVVCKWFGFINDGGQHYHHFVLKGREHKLLEFARQLEQEEKKRNKK